MQMPSGTQYRSSADVRGAEAPFAIIGTNMKGDTFVGTGDPSLDGNGRPSRIVFVDVLDPETGRTWFGAATVWRKTKDSWQWSLAFSMVCNTSDQSDGFGCDAGSFEVLAYYDERNPRTGLTEVKQARPFVLTVGGQVSQDRTSSMPDLLASIRKMSQQQRQCRYEADGFAERARNFSFVSRSANSLTNGPFNVRRERSKENAAARPGTVDPIFQDDAFVFTKPHTSASTAKSAAAMGFKPR